MTTKIQFGNGPDDHDGMEVMEVRKATGEGAAEDARLQQALTDFRISVQAWSEAANIRPRSIEARVRQRSWRLAAGWALGCVLLAGGVTGAVVEHRRQQEAARIAVEQQQQARQQQVEAARERARQEDQGLMAKVDSDISQEVPDAMEPLAQMMEGGETQ